MKAAELQSANVRITSMLEGIGREIEALLVSAGGQAQQHPLLGAFVFELNRKLEEVNHRSKDILAVLMSRSDETVEKAVDKALADGTAVVAPDGKGPSGLVELV